MWVLVLTHCVASYFSHEDFWRNLNFPLKYQVKLDSMSWPFRYENLAKSELRNEIALIDFKQRDPINPVLVGVLVNPVLVGWGDPRSHSGICYHTESS